MTMPKRGAAHGHRPVYWWNEDIAKKRKICIAKRRAYQRRGRRQQQREDEQNEYNEAKRDLRIAIKKSQENAWADLVDSVEGDVWGTPYRLVSKKLARQPKNTLTRGREAKSYNTYSQGVLLSYGMGGGGHGRASGIPDSAIE